MTDSKKPKEKSMDWFGLGSFLITAGRAIYDYGWGTPKEEAERARQHREILAAISKSTALVLNAAVAVEIARLEGEVNGFHSIFATYDADPADKNEEGRLVSIADGSAITLDNLAATMGLIPKVGVEVDDATRNAMRELAFESTALFMPLVFLRVHALVEREKTYGAKEVEDVPAVIDHALKHLGLFLAELRKMSDARFSGLAVQGILRPGAVLRFTYTFNGKAFRCSLVRDKNALKASEAIRQKHMAAEYPTYRNGAGPAIARVMEQMQAIKNEALAGTITRLAPLPAGRDTP